MIWPAVGQPVYDTRNGREGRIVEIPSPYSPFVHVEWSAYKSFPGGGVTVTSLEHLAYRPFGFTFNAED